MNARGLAAAAVVCGTVVLAGWGAGGHLGSPRIEDTASVDSQAMSRSAATEPLDGRQPAAGEGGAPVADAEVMGVALPVPMPPSDTPLVPVSVIGTPDPPPDSAQAPASPAASTDACLMAEGCIDEYLWSVYQRTPKLDTVKVSEQVKVTVKKNGKTRTITKNIAKLVDEDFTWKDPKAAQRAGMSLMDYVIGGMDRSFKLKLYHALRAMDDAGLAPGMTSAFRDDYRQTLASGKKAAPDSSYHGGSRRGGYGHGLAADLVSVRGETRAERWISSGILWKWIDEHGQEFGIARPYLDRDPPHVGPIDGQEYADKRGLRNPKLARLEKNGRHGSAAGDDRRRTK